jgi:protein-tyrosine phosphatase
MIPGVDDGSSSIEESLAALLKMAEQGITHVITTPHFRASALNSPHEFTERMNEIDEAWEKLRSAVSESRVPLRLDRGVEMALDEPIVSPTDERTRLAGTRFMLVEFPYFTIPPNSGQALAQLRATGITPIVAHPERYENLEKDLESLFLWKQSGAFLQLNSGSITGAYGTRVERNGWRCLEAGVVDFLSSDYHARGNCLAALAKERMEEYGGSSHFRVLSTINGERLLSGIDPAPVSPLRRQASRWRRLKRAFRLERQPPAR